jgi:hypothetical protein
MQAKVSAEDGPVPAPPASSLTDRTAEQRSGTSDSHELCNGTGARSRTDLNRCGRRTWNYGSLGRASIRAASRALPACDPEVMQTFKPTRMGGVDFQPNPWGEGRVHGVREPR